MAEHDGTPPVLDIRTLKSLEERSAVERHPWLILQINLIS